jgi:hypothetical protein
MTSFHEMSCVFLMMGLRRSGLTWCMRALLTQNFRILPFLAIWPFWFDQYSILVWPHFGPVSWLIFKFDHRNLTTRFEIWPLFDQYVFSKLCFYWWNFTTFSNTYPAWKNILLSVNRNYCQPWVSFSVVWVYSKNEMTSQTFCVTCGPSCFQ